MRRSAGIGCCVTILLCANFVATAQDVDEKARKSELKSLIGKWIVQIASRDGKQRKEETGAELSIFGDYLVIRMSDSFELMYMELGVQNLNGNPKHLWFRPVQEGNRLKCALDLYGGSGYEVKGDTLKLCFLAPQAWPTDISDQKQVIWILRRETADYRREKLDKRLHGKQILPYDKVVKQGERFDDDVEFSGTKYIHCRDSHHFFLEPYQAPASPWNRGPFSKFTKVLHGMRTVQTLQGETLIENYYAGDLHGQQLTLKDGKCCGLTTYQFGVRHGIAQQFHGNGRIHVEEDYVEGRKISARYFHDNGQPSNWWVGQVLREERDEKGKLIPTRKIEMQKLFGTWDIVTATKDGKPRAGEKGGELTFIEDEVRVKLPGKKGTMTMNVHLRAPDTHPFIDFHSIVLEPRFGSPLEQIRGGRYAVDGNTLTLTFRTAANWPKDLTDHGQVRWLLRKNEK